jgi:hypothetical protein
MPCSQKELHVSSADVGVGTSSIGFATTPSRLGGINALEVILAHILISSIPMHTFYALVGCFLAGIEELGAALAVRVSSAFRSK